MKFEEEIKKYLKNKTNIKDVDITNISSKNGIYIVALSDDGKVSVSDKTTAIKSYTKSGKEVNLLYDKSKLDDKLKECNKKYLYIGKAERKDGLNKRINELMKYAYAKCKIHRGGRALWQIGNWQENLCLYWCEVENAENAEKQLLKMHRSEYGVYPFANWRL